MHSASSIRVHTSVMRISSVGTRALGRMSHHSLVASSIRPAATRLATVRSYSPALWKVSGSPERGSSSITESR